MSDTDWVNRLWKILIRRVKYQDADFVNAERIIVAGNFCGIIATLSLISMTFSSGIQTSMDLFLMLVIFTGGFVASLLGRWVEVIWFRRLELTGGGLLLSRFALLFLGMLLMAAPIAI